MASNYVVTSQPRTSARVECEPFTEPFADLRTLNPNKNPFRIGWSRELDEIILYLKRLEQHLSNELLSVAGQRVGSPVSRDRRKDAFAQTNKRSSPGNASRAGV
jgi:hypothetical protein